MDITQLKSIQSNFLKELRDAYSGKKTSLPFIVHKISTSPIVKDNEVFQVLVVGGTMNKRALLRKTKGAIEILEKKDERQLSFRNEEGFLKFINDELDNRVGTLALNFAYPIKPVFENGRLDGILLKVTKEGSFHGLIGKKIAKEIEQYILKKRNKKITVSIANDTVCLLLSGLTKYNWHELAGGVNGTGVNFAFFLDKNSLVNLESANFDKFTKSKEGKIIDRESNNPHGWVFEKETAGAYLYKHFNLIIKERDINYPQISSTEELNRISLDQDYSSSEVRQLTDESRSLNSDSSRLTSFARTITNPEVSQIARDILGRSAQLVACQIAGIAEFKKKSMVFNMEGSLFWKGNGYKETVEQTARQLVPRSGVRFVEIKDSNILGAAKLVS